MLFCGIIFLQSCKKDQEAQYVTLDENIKSGSTYSLDLSEYGERNAISSITTQALNYTVSQIDIEPVTGKPVYHFSSDTKTDDMETIVINVTGKRNGRCNQSNKKKTITIHISVQP